MKKAFILLMLSFQALSAVASIKIGDLYFELNEENLTATVTYEKYEHYENYEGLTCITIPESVRYNSKTYVVVSIGNKAFDQCFCLTSIEIPNSITSIGTSAFLGCSDLSNVEIPNSVTYIGGYAFSGCCSLKSVTIPNSVTEIREGAFFGCDGLTSVTIPNSITSIGISAFYGCSGLTSIEIPNSVTSIGTSAFHYCTGLTKIDISDLEAWCNINFGNDIANPLYYGCHLFLNGEEVKNVVIPSTITSIKDSAFQNCYSLTNVIIPNSVISIGNSAFRGCNAMRNVKISNSVTSIGINAFEVYSLAAVDIDDLESWCKIDFANLYANPLFFSGHLYLNNKEIKQLKIPDSINTLKNYTFAGCGGITSIEIPPSIKEIGEGSFTGCTRLTSLEIPSSVTAIRDGAFNNCIALTSVKIPDSVLYIGNDAFSWCDELLNIYIGENVKSIGSNAFEWCYKLTDIVSYPVLPPTIEDDTFNWLTYQEGRLFIPEEAFISYQSVSPWNNFLNVKTLEESGEKRIQYTEESSPNVYGINGILLKRNGSKGNIDTLSPGIYIRGGKKVIVR